MFGNFFKTLDEKNRIIIPANLREELGEIFFISLGLDKIIEFRSQEEFKRIQEKINQENMINKKVREFARFFFGNTTQVSCDKQGRVLLPKNLLDSTAINKDVYLVGVGKKIELWPAEKYEEITSQYSDEKTIEELEQALAEAGVEL